MNTSRLLLSLCCATVALLWMPPRAQASTEVSTKVFRFEGRRIHVDIYLPAESLGPSKRPVLLLHGAGGTVFDGPDIRRVAEALAEAGHPAYVLHYFDRTHTVAARDQVLRKNFETWLPTVRVAILWVQAQTPPTAVRSTAIDVYGYSLGAFLAISAASNNPKVAAVAEEAGGIWNNDQSRIGRMPRVLMLHGRKDERVPFAQYAPPLLTVLRQRGSGVRTHFFPKEGHRFSTEAQVQATKDVVAFFDRGIIPPRKIKTRAASPQKHRPRQQAEPTSVVP
ncbi:MAG: prolyl oligopeptidase family serine peptidase [Verrucomicrobia bacterium]|nr:prolyl oligopeptidase family serine peptidase [Verrucomicrobiota bacterium]MBV9658547.1 prolyl oligopeptidase family serine peptidase [Verrucomicrobiota bacterium]